MGRHRREQFTALTLAPANVFQIIKKQIHTVENKQLLSSSVLLLLLLLLLLWSFIVIAYNYFKTTVSQFNEQLHW